MTIKKRFLRKWEYCREEAKSS